MKKTIALGSLVCAGVMAGSLSWAANLESPAKEAVLSGIGFISGWKCEASNITVSIDGGEHISVAMGQSRGDLRPVCGSVNHGFIVQMNWELVGAGEHEAVAYDNGVEFDRAVFTVGSTGEEFVTNVTRQVVVEGFPAPGEWALLEWNESTQHFEIRTVFSGPVPEGYAVPYWRQMSMDLSEGTYQTAAALYEDEPDPNTCRAGRLTQAGKGRALEAMNQIRALHGLEPMQYSYHYDNQMQQASLIQAANRFVTHRPPASAECYTPDGAVGSGSSNLSGYLAAPQVSRDPAAHMIGWTNDNGGPGFGNPAGHRRWILNPFGVYMSYGQVLGYAAQKVFGFDAEPQIHPRIAVDFVALPYETYPFNLVQRYTPWSFSVIEDKSNLRGNEYPYFENASITVRLAPDGPELITSDRYSDTIGYGLPNFLSWQVEGWDYDTLYQVEINNVGMRGGGERSYSYPVLIDRDNIEY